MRKDLIEAVAALSDSAARMGGEPVATRRGLEEMTAMLIAASMFAAQVSAARFDLKEAEGLDAPEVQRRIEAARKRIVARLAAASAKGSASRDERPCAARSPQRGRRTAGRGGRDLRRRRPYALTIRKLSGLISASATANMAWTLLCAAREDESSKMRILSGISDLLVLLPASLGLIALLARAGARAQAIAYAKALLFSLTAVFAMKFALASCGPASALPGVESPSGHVAVAATFVGSLVFMFGAGRPAWMRLAAGRRRRRAGRADRAEPGPARRPQPSRNGDRRRRRGSWPWRFFARTFRAGRRNDARRGAAAARAAPRGLWHMRANRGQSLDGGAMDRRAGR